MIYNTIHNVRKILKLRGFIFKSSLKNFLKIQLKLINSLN